MSMVSQKIAVSDVHHEGYLLGVDTVVLILACILQAVYHQICTDKANCLQVRRLLQLS